MTTPIATARRRYRFRIPAGFYVGHSSRPGVVVRTDRRSPTSMRVTVEMTAGEIGVLAREAAEATAGDDPTVANKAAALLASLSRTLAELRRR
jgi:hypothetical protein